MSATLTKKKTAPKTETTMIENPSISQSEYDCVSQRLNSNGNAIVLTLSLFVGSAETIKFTPDGEKEEIGYAEVGGINLDDTFELLDGTKCRFRVIKGKQGRPDRLVVRPISEKTRKGKEKPQF